MSQNYDSVPLSIAEDIKANIHSDEDDRPEHLAVNVERNKVDDVDQTDDINSNSSISNESSIDPTKTYVTKYDNCGLFIWCLTCLFLVAWIVWMYYNFGRLNGNQQSEIIPRILIQILLILLIILQIFLLIKSALSGIQIYEPEEKPAENPGKLKQIINKAKALKIFYETHRLNVRNLVNQIPNIHPFLDEDEEETPQQRAVEFLYSSFIGLAVMKLIADLIPIIINLCAAEESELYNSGMILLYSALGNIFVASYAKYSCCCNPCRIQWCWYKSEWDSICRYISCQCCYETHFPQHHLPYVHTSTMIMLFSAGLKFAGAMGQISAITDIYTAYRIQHVQEATGVDISSHLQEVEGITGIDVGSYTESYFEGYTLWDLWWTCFNFLLGVYGIICVLQIHWRYYYLLCFYWSRMAVNKYENHKIMEIIGGLLKGVYGLCYIKMDEEKDEFVTIDDNESIAERVKVKCDCFTVCCMVLPSLGLCIGIAVILFMNTMFLNDMTPYEM